MTEATPSAVSSNVTMESVDSLVHVPPEQLHAFVQHANAVLGNPEETHAPESVVPSHAPSATNDSSATENRPKISCETFTAQTTKFSGEDLRISAANWVEVNKREFAAYLPGVQEQMWLNAAYPLLTGEAMAAVGQLLFNTLEELYRYLLDAFPQADVELKVLQVINSGKLFKDAPKRALGTFAYAVYHNMDHNNPLAAFLITNSLYMVNILPFAVKDTKLQEIRPVDIEKMCKYIDCINTIDSDTGAKVCLITEQAAKRIGLNITTNSRLLLCALWLDATLHRSVGHMHIHLCVDNGPQVRAYAIVVSFGKVWDILVGSKTLQQLGIQLTSPVMDRHLHSSTKVTDYPTKMLDGLWRQQTVVPSVEEAYDNMPNTTPSHDLAFPSPTEASSAVAPVVEPVVVRPMHAHLGLPVDFFMPECNDDFHRLNALYLEVTKYGIDESSQAFTQLPIFTKSKPNTTERRILFDDSANNSLNMINIGMQLLTPIEHALFLRNAYIVSSIDMASFFT
ncbi:hypothetical protein COEREDRAFT_12598 [Coemansia reversa NRRL 1564]|uniref:Uncharacterized protein n=1 Tax=Coemansia reversa (strain ATCC 12441 / NRRL 1564) TaxID=763665 RepID=A0A2G5B0L5_COERN|nr:hypothetical protein COEREDRAFT_12598 [Coemansia reversa NRRL 1564]|eukprot:PIA12562.1 hypothetical protein COEREDRAFT_12598 [Coemansia reversa NRRL 1564]